MMTSGSELREDWHDWRYDGRGWYLLNDPEITFGSGEEAMAYCDEHNRALVGQAAINERNRIIATIKGRRDLHVSFVDHALNAGVQPSDSIYTAIAELDAILRELEQ